MILTQLPEDNLREFGEYPFIYYGDTEYTNKQLIDSANRVAAALQQHGIKKSDRVIVCMPNAPEVFFSYQGIMRAGAIVIPVMYLLHPREIAFVASDSEAKAVITSPEVLPSILEATKDLPSKPLILVTGGELPAEAAGHEHVHNFQQTLDAAGTEYERPDTVDTDIAVILYTSGTTGKPKGVMLTHKNLYTNAAVAVEMAEDQDEEERRGTTLGILPLAHIYGFTMANVLYLMGSSVAVMPKYDLDEVCQAIEKHKVRAFAAVPAMIYHMLMDPTTEKYDLSSLETVGSGASPLPVTVIEGFKAKFGADILEGYGLSEAAPTVSAHRRNEPIKPGSVGRPIPGVKVKIVGADGEELPTGEVGELLVQGDNVSPGYFRNDEATREAFQDGWLRTGDMAKLDEDGYLYIVDRKKDLIIRGGFNIYPRDLEEVLSKHPAVGEVAVVGATSSEMGEEVVAFVIKKDEASEEELIKYAQDNLAKYKTPRRILFVDDFPRNGVGKIMKKELRDRVEEMKLFA